jgi:photosystem II stability/assembly factor-like uncharacterized protein
MREEELRRRFRSLAEPVADGVTPPDPRLVRARGRRRRRRLLAGTALVVAVALAGVGGAWAGLIGPPVPSLTGVGPASPTTVPPPPGSAPPPPGNTAPSLTATTSGAAASPATTLPLGRIQRLDAVQAIGGTGTVFAVGTGTILATSDFGRTWARVWRGAQQLRDVDFVSAATGWALGDSVLLGTVDGGQHWHRLGQPRAGPLRRVHFTSRTQGWGVAGGTAQLGQGPMQVQGTTTLVHTSDGGRSWSALAAPAPPQSVCFTAPDDGWLASGTSVWRSTDGGHRWGLRPSFTLPLSAGGLPAFAELQCAAPGAAWVRVDAGDAAAGHRPYALYATGDGGAHWRGVLGEAGTLGNLLRLPAGPGSYPGPLSVIDPNRAFLLSPTPAAEATGAVLISQGSRLRRLPDIPRATLAMPLSVSFASATRGWVVGSDGAGRAVLLATTDGGRSWQSQLPA